MFCDSFDAMATRWEVAQQSLVDGFDGERCIVCCEMRPKFMRALHRVDDAFLNNFKTPGERALFDHARYRGARVCLCAAPPCLPRLHPAIFTHTRARPLECGGGGSACRRWGRHMGGAPPE